MIRVSVFSKKEIYKYTIKLGFIALILFIIIKIYAYSKEHFSEKQITIEQGISYLAEEITAMGKAEPKNILEVDSKELIESELRMSMAVSSRNSSVVQSNSNEDGNLENSQDFESNTESTENKNGIDEVSSNLPTEVVQTKYKDTYNYELNGVKIKNETSYDLSTMDLTTNITVDNKNIIIFHTHTCESYTQTEANSYEPSGDFRTTDLNYSVARVGDELEKYLSSYEFNVIHDKTYHDYPAYTGSYGRSLTTVSNILANSEDTDIIIDLHRDAIGDDTYAPKVKIGDEYAAQIMFVIGTDGSGLEHPNWKHNLEFAIKVQEKANEMYPGLFKAILVRNARYNQHLSPDATIMEFGATGNTLEECEVSAKYLAKVLSEVVK